MSSRAALTCGAGALALAAGTLVLGCQHHWITAIVLMWVAFILLVLAVGREQHDRVVRARHEQARRAAAMDEQTLTQVPSPCCQFWTHSDGRAHGPDCTRPPLTRRDRYHLDPATAEAFAEITAHFDDRSAA